eukprot:266104-Rhodomonas_salina.1
MLLRQAAIPYDGMLVHYVTTVRCYGIFVTRCYGMLIRAQVNVERITKAEKGVAVVQKRQDGTTTRTYNSNPNRLLKLNP